MTKERLQLLSYADLEKAALKVGLDVHSEKSKDDLIESILEALEEEKIERSVSNNLIMKIEEKKYDIQSEDSLEYEEVVGDIEIKRLNTTRIVLMLRDPEWGFCYWLLNKEDRKYFSTNEVSMFLRIFELNHKNFEHSEISDYYEVPIRSTDSNWYLNLPKTGQNYCVALMYEENGIEKMLCRSNVVYSPNISFSLGAGAVPEEILVKNGLYDDLLSGDVAPQRILSDSELD
ncbi:MAG: DUF4912 domain-containing protein [Spirochaetales bacterium]|nr:DUF4912 domain-containing protein [Spirochaetales bacterium]